MTVVPSNTNCPLCGVRILYPCLDNPILTIHDGVQAFFCADSYGCRRRGVDRVNRLNNEISKHFNEEGEPETLCISDTPLSPALRDELVERGITFTDWQTKR